MANYQNAKIYRILSLNGGLCYIGSTTKPLAERFLQHMYGYKEKKQYCSSWEVLNKGDCVIELVKYFNCNSKTELAKEEGKYQREYDCVNKRIAGRTPNDYYREHKECILIKTKIYREKNKDKTKAYQKTYRKENKDKINERQKKWRSLNKDKTVKYQAKRIVCNICNSNILRNGLVRHQRSKKCKSHLLLNL